MASGHQHGSPHAYGTGLSPGASQRAQYQLIRRSAADELALTAEMRDRQARGKDPYRSNSDDSDENYHLANYRGPKEDSHAVVESQREAASVLDCPEMLMMHAQRDGDSIPATRLRFTKILCGQPEKASKKSSSSAASSTTSSRKHSGSHRPSSGTSRRTSDRTSRS